MSGELQLIMGPMFSGKSSELLRRARRYQFARKSVVVLKYVGAAGGGMPRSFENLRLSVYPPHPSV